MVKCALTLLSYENTVWPSFARCYQVRIAIHMGCHWHCGATHVVLPFVEHVPHSKIIQVIRSNLRGKPKNNWSQRFALFHMHYVNWTYYCLHSITPTYKFLFVDVTCFQLHLLTYVWPGVGMGFKHNSGSPGFQFMSFMSNWQSSIFLDLKF